jgi:hypothetical protein
MRYFCRPILDDARSTTQSYCALKSSSYTCLTYSAGCPSNCGSNYKVT